jgi:Sulfotransferase family
MTASTTDRPIGSTWTPQPRPPWVAQLNELGINPGSPAALVALDERSLIDAAVAATGLEDFGDADGWREGFRVLLDCLESTADLTLVGRLMARSEIVRTLIARLRITETYNTNPEIAEQDIKEPVFITGMGRSGTSILHALMDLDPRFRAPLTWEWLYPCPPPDAATRASDPRLRKADVDQTFWFQITPEVQVMHDNRGDEPNECSLGLTNLFASEVWGGAHFIPQYDVWLALFDKAKLYRFHRKLLKLLQFRAPGRWLLKGPGHLMSLPALFAEYPDARVVVTHRDPLKVMPSMVDLVATLQWQRCDHVDYNGIVQRLSIGYPYVMNHMMEQRRSGALPEDRIIDINYSDLVADPVPTITRLYDQLGTSLSTDGQQQIRDHLAARPKDLHGAHRYSFDHLGLDRATMRAAFRDYQHHFDVRDEA